MNEESTQVKERALEQGAPIVTDLVNDTTYVIAGYEVHHPLTFIPHLHGIVFGIGIFQLLYRDLAPWEVYFAWGCIAYPALLAVRNAFATIANQILGTHILTGKWNKGAKMSKPSGFVPGFHLPLIVVLSVLLYQHLNYVFIDTYMVKKNIHERGAEASVSVFLFVVLITYLIGFVNFIRKKTGRL